MHACAKDLLAHAQHRQQLLPAIWQVFLLLAEHVMKVCGLQGAFSCREQTPSSKLPSTHPGVHAHVRVHV